MKIKNNPLTWLILTAIVMLVFPWLTYTFIKGDTGMAVCFILFFVINPLSASSAAYLQAETQKSCGYARS